MKLYIILYTYPKRTKIEEGNILLMRKGIIIYIIIFNRHPHRPLHLLHLPFLLLVRHPLLQ